MAAISGASTDALSRRPACTKDITLLFVGRMRTDLLVIWPWSNGVQKTVIELKVRHKTLEQTLVAGLEQTWEYLDRCGAEEGHLVIFDRTPGKPWEEKLFQRTEAVRDKAITVWGM